MANTATPKQLDELQDAAEKLVELLEDRHPELLAWRLYVNERVAEIARLAAVAGLE